MKLGLKISRSFILAVVFFIMLNSTNTKWVFGQSNARFISNENSESGVESFGSKRGSHTDKVESQIGIMPIPSTGPGMVSAVYYGIHVLGEVARPGTYKVLPSDRVTDALKYAGNVLSNGSERYVQLRRNGAIQTLDLYSYKYDGFLQQNPYLMENDVIFVPLRKGEVEIQGPVKRPGHYEIGKTLLLKNMINRAGGFSSGLSLKAPIRIVRINAQEKKEVIEVENTNEQLDTFYIQKGDIVVVPHVLTVNHKFEYDTNRIPGDNIFYPTTNTNVYVAGSVVEPGAYPFQPSFTYSDYLNLAGVSERSSMRRAKIIDANGKKSRVGKQTIVNPGDTIIVPSKSITATNALTWFNSLANVALTTFIFYDRFAQ